MYRLWRWGTNTSFTSVSISFESTKYFLFSVFRFVLFPKSKARILRKLSSGSLIGKRYKNVARVMKLKDNVPNPTGNCWQVYWSVPAGSSGVAGIVAGVVIALIAVIAVIVFVVWYMKRQRRPVVAHVPSNVNTTTVIQQALPPPQHQQPLPQTYGNPPPPAYGDVSYGYRNAGPPPQPGAYQGNYPPPPQGTYHPLAQGAFSTPISTWIQCQVWWSRLI